MSDSQYVARPAYYPVFVDLTDRSTVVIGGGKVAERKVETLLSCGASVRVVSPCVTDAIQARADAGEIELHLRCYEEGDLAGACMAYCACGVPSVNSLCHEEARRVGCLMNVVDVPSECDFIVPSIVSRGPLTIAVSTSGTAPTEAKSIRRSLERQFDDSWADYLELMGQVRLLVKERIEGSDETRRPYYEAASAAGWRERIAAGETIEPEDAYRQACSMVEAR